MLRWAVAADAGEIARIYLEALKDTYAEILPKAYFDHQTLPKAVKIWTDFLKKPEAGCLIWEQEGSTAAFAGVRRTEENAADLSALYVDRRWRGQGIGKKLIRAVLDEAEARGFSNVSISVVLQNARAKDLYERMGAEFQKEFTYFFDEYPVGCGEYLWRLPRCAAEEPASGETQRERERHA